MWTFDTGMEARGKGIGRNTPEMPESGKVEGVIIERMIDNHYPADPRSVPRARHDALALLREVGVGEDDCAALDLALGEALANAVRHGRTAATDDQANTITMSLWRYRNTVIAFVHDKGTGFEPPLPPYPMPAPTADFLGGRGLPLMEQLTDAFLICRGDTAEGGSSVYLIKRIDATPESLLEAV